MNLTHPDDWEALEADHLELSALLDPETNAESCCQLGLDIPSLTAWYHTIHTENTMTENTNTDTIQTLFDEVRRQSTQFNGEVSQAFMVGYYEGLIRILAKRPETFRHIQDLRLCDLK